MNPLTALTYLAPNMFSVYQALIDHTAQQLGVPIHLRVGAHDYADFESADLHFICGLPYIKRAPQIEAIAAPVLEGERYADTPIYFSDVIVHRDSPYQTFDDLRGATWAYNEPESQSGYGITRYTLVQRGYTNGFFGSVIRAGFHQKAIRMVRAGKIDAAAIDSQVLAVDLRQHPDLGDQLRVIDSFGPSTIQPITAAGNMPDALKADIQQVLTTAHHDPNIKKRLDEGFIRRIAPVTDSDYDDIRMMLKTCQEANFLTIR